MSLMYPFKHFHLSNENSIHHADAATVVLWVSLSVMTYLICLALTKWLGSKPSLEWIVGAIPAGFTLVARERSLGARTRKGLAIY